MQFFKKKHIEQKTTTMFKQFSQLSKEEVIQQLDGSMYGLKKEEVEDRLKKYGKNVFSHKRFVWYKKLMHNIFNPFIIVLMIIVIYNFISYSIIDTNTDKNVDLYSAIIVLVMIILSVFISYFQDYRSYKSSEKLRQLIETTASVFRFSNKNKKIDFNALNSVANFTKEVLIENLVPGDIIFLSSGDMIPADVRILVSTDLFINQSALTGETFPVEKHAINTKDDNKKSSILELENICFMGTSIVSGGAIAIVIASGVNTYFGSIASAVTSKRPVTSFSKGIKKVTYILIGFMCVMVPLIFIVNVITKNNILTALIFSISVAVGITPEMLPMIVSANLAKGAIRLSHKKVIVKNLTSIQSFGAMDVLCTDKTGTLTEDRIELVKHLDPEGVESNKVLEMAYLNSSLQTGLKNNIDKTIVQHIKAHHNKIVEMPYRKIDEIPFDFIRRRMSIVVSKDKINNTLICKGAVEEILKICTKVEIGGKVITLTDKIKENVLKLSTELNNDGLRVIAIGYQDFASDKTVFKIEDESNLVLLGYIGFLDVPKPSAIKAITTLNQHGIDVKILTGDNEIVTKAICKKVGLEPGIPLLGSDIEDMDDQHLQALVNKTTIFAKMDPLQKSRIIDILKLNGHTVGFLGDGINDAVALHHADVGISVNSATDIAKEASDIILLEKDLDVLEQGVISGRNTFGNILKYIKITISSNFGNSLSILIASIWLPFLPMMAIQILLQNLLYDISQLAIPWDRVDEDFIKKPQKWNAKSILPFAFWNGPLSSIFDITTFLFLGYGLHIFANFANVDPNSAAGIYQQSLFHTGWFILGVTSQTLIVQLLRTSKVPFIQSMPSHQLFLTTIIITIIGISIPYTQLGATIGLTPIPLIFYAYLAGVVIVYFIASQLLKMIYIKVNKRWL
ncbi:magnesium-translocating P-type ATPase [Spiroplasma endosymbiont of Lariophagus distinguendus]|uniref:magnesium-translocating P-type ATPase n=1 Tax=Spiroplasma endosymbiont of Lariophagus distinguendus TaxID=2935082 RepID=UPI00207A7780|nr:magnesium-translocating P-type ATPase [Spiroplasma endosymbiont of Lariophagus distinguendus]